MRGIAVVVVYDVTGKNVLLCERGSDPYRGLLDFPGGQCGAGENALACAYRRLETETGIARADVSLWHIMDFAYHTTGWCVQVFSGQLTRRVGLRRGPRWTDAGEDFFDTARYAGEGYIGHILAHIGMQLFAPGQ